MIPVSIVGDDAPFVQNMIDEAYQDGGGEVYLEAGVWTFRSQVILRRGVSLIGEGRHFDMNYQRTYGTVIQVLWGQGNGASEDTSKAAVLMEPATRIQSLAFEHPEQNEALPVPLEYGPTVKMFDDRDASIDVYHGDARICDVFFYKSYVAIDARGTSCKAAGSGTITTHRYSNILMSALKYGIRMDNVSDWTFISEVEQQPGFIGHYAEPNNSLRYWVQRNAAFLQFSGLMDWINLSDCTCWATAIGVELDGVQGPLTFINCAFDASLIGVHLKGQSNNVQAKFVGCTFTIFDTVSLTAGVPGFSGFVVVPAAHTVADGLTFSSCFLFGPSKGWGWFGNPGVDVKNFILQGCTTKVADMIGGPTEVIHSGNGLDFVVANGNIFSGTNGLINGNASTFLDTNNLYH